MRRIHARALVLGVGLAVLAQAADARGPCNPPRQTCDDGDGISYLCPPCPPRAQNPSQLERFRDSLELYRGSVESVRARDPGGALDSYRKSIESYRDGIARYRGDRGSAAAATPQSEGL